MEQSPVRVLNSALEGRWRVRLENRHPAIPQITPSMLRWTVSRWVTTERPRTNATRARRPRC